MPHYGTTPKARKAVQLRIAEKGLHIPIKLDGTRKRLGRHHTVRVVLDERGQAWLSVMPVQRRRRE